MNEKTVVKINGNINQLQECFQQQQREVDIFLETTDLHNGFTKYLKDTFSHWDNLNDTLTATISGYVKNNEIIWENMYKYKKQEHRQAKIQVGYEIMASASFDEMEENEFSETELRRRIANRMNENDTDIDMMRTLIMIGEYYAENNIPKEEYTTDIKKLIQDNNFWEWLEENNYKYSWAEDIIDEEEEEYREEVKQYMNEQLSELQPTNAYGRYDITDIMWAIKEQMEEQHKEEYGAEVEYEIN